jgi:hypothetical protein
VTGTSALTPDSTIDRIFGPAIEARTYRHLLYEFISFPLALTAFVMTISGLATGVGLAIILVGFVILAVTLAMCRLFGQAERRMVQVMLGATFHRRDTAARETWTGLRAGLTEQRSWAAAAYFILRLPVAVLGFVAAMLLIGSVPVMATPLLYPIVAVMVGGERVTTPEEATLVSLAGCILYLLSVHAVNGVAAVSRRLATALL